MKKFIISLIGACLLFGCLGLGGGYDNYPPGGRMNYFDVDDSEFVVTHMRNKRGFKKCILYKVRMISKTSVGSSIFWFVGKRGAYKVGDKLVLEKKK